MVMEWMVWAVVGALAVGVLIGNWMAYEILSDRIERERENEWQNGFAYGYARGREGYNIITGEIENGD